MRVLGAGAELAWLPMRCRLTVGYGLTLTRRRRAASRQSFYSMDMQQVPQGMGSGFIWDQKARAPRAPACPAAVLPLRVCRRCVTERV
jgi:hypothetical protein